MFLSLLLVILVVGGVQVVDFINVVNVVWDYDGIWCVDCQIWEVDQEMLVQGWVVLLLIIDVSYCYLEIN